MSRVIALLTGAFLLFVTTLALGHSFYDPWCCNTNDCQPIPKEAVALTPRGYLVTLRPVDHPALAKEVLTHTYLVPFREAKVSPDGGYHGCVYPSPETLRCLYVPPMGS